MSKAQAGVGENAKAGAHNGSGIPDVNLVPCFNITMPGVLEGLEVHAKTSLQALGKFFPLSQGSGDFLQGRHAPCVNQKRDGIGREKIGGDRILVGHMVVAEFSERGEMATGEHGFSLGPDSPRGIGAYEPECTQRLGGSLNKPEGGPVFDETLHDLMLEEVNILVPEYSLNKRCRRKLTAESPGQPLFCENLHGLTIGYVSGQPLIGQVRDESDFQGPVVFHA